MILDSENNENILSIALEWRSNETMIIDTTTTTTCTKNESRMLLIFLRSKLLLFSLQLSSKSSSLLIRQQRQQQQRKQTTGSSVLLSLRRTTRSFVKILLITIIIIMMIQQLSFKRGITNGFTCIQQQRPSSSFVRRTYQGFRIVPKQTIIPSRIIDNNNERQQRVRLHSSISTINEQTNNTLLSNNEKENDIVRDDRFQDEVDEYGDDDKSNDGTDKNYIPPWNNPNIIERQLKRTRNNNKRFRQHVNPLARQYQLPTELSTTWPTDVYTNCNKPIHIDIGCGKGGYLIDLIQYENNEEHETTSTNLQVVLMCTL